jgi:hypothetical protein
VRVQCSVHPPDAEIIEVPQQFRRILIDTIGASALSFLLAVASRE